MVVSTKTMRRFWRKAIRKERNNGSIDRILLRIVLGFPSEFLYAENLEEARLLVAGSRGFLPLEGGERQAAEPLARVPLVRNGAPLLRTYCAFWKKENVNPYVPEFARLLKEQFDT